MHKNAKVITAWVNGATVRARSPTTDEWIVAPSVTTLGEEDYYREPSPIHPDYDYLGWEIGND